MSSTLFPDGVTPAKPTAVRADAFAALMEDVGLSAVFERALVQISGRPAIVPGRPSVGYGVQAPVEGEGAPAEEPDDDEILAQVLVHLMLRGGIGRLASIVLQGDEAAVREADDEAIAEGLRFFVTRCAVLTSKLLSCGMTSASPLATTATA